MPSASMEEEMHPMRGSALSKPHSSWGRPTINKQKSKEIQIIILALTWSWGNSHPTDRSQRRALWGNAI